MESTPDLVRPEPSSSHLDATASEDDREELAANGPLPSTEAPRDERHVAAVEAPPPPPIATLSPELLTYILALSDPGQFGSPGQTEHFCRLAVVSRAWTDPCQRILWRRVVLRGSTRLLRCLASPSLGRFYTSHLHLGGAESLKEIGILQHFKGLSSLVLLSHISIPLATFGLESLADLQSLTLHGCKLAPTYGAASRFRLRNLTIVGDCIPHNLLRPLLLSSTSHLQSLTLLRCKSSTIFIHLRELAPSLTDLTLDEALVAHDRPPFPASSSSPLTPLTRFLLKTTSLTSFSLSSDSIENEFASPSGGVLELDHVLSALTATPLRRLSLGVGKVVPKYLEVLMKFLLRPVYGELERLELPYVSAKEAQVVEGGAYLVLQLGQKGTEVRWFDQGF